MRLALLASISVVPFILAPAVANAQDKFQILMVSGGCCHNYPAEREIIEAALEAKLNVEVTHVFKDVHTTERDENGEMKFAEGESRDTATKPALPILDDANYAEGYDLVIHDECGADLSDPAQLENVLAPHKAGLPGVALHCAMHSYRTEDVYSEPVTPGEPGSFWFEFTGIQSTGHGPQKPIEVAIAEPAHPVATNVQPWTTGDDELYNNLTEFDVTPVLTGTSSTQEEAEDRGPVTLAWVHDYGPNNARVFSTTLFHNEVEMANENYQQLLVNGVAWALGQLNDDGSLSDTIAVK